jgi:dTDP-4-dehydrorhamnose 3,5-epimerase-like enzyme
MNLNFSQITEGGLFSDSRGSVAFINDFNLSPIKRFYLISHPNTDVIRAWQGHKIERKWFFCTKGSFEIKVIKIDTWEHPSKDLHINNHVLNANKSQVLAVNKGCCTAIRALEKNASLLVFSDKTLEEAKNDDFRFDKNYWFNWETLI